MSDSAIGFLQRTGRLKVIPEVRMRLVPKDVTYSPRGIEYPYPILQKQTLEGVRAKSDSATQGWPYPEIRKSGDPYDH